MQTSLLEEKRAGHNKPRSRQRGGEELLASKVRRERKRKKSLV